MRSARRRRAQLESSEAAASEEEPVYQNLFLTLNSVTIDVNQQPPRLITLYDAEDMNLASLAHHAMARGRPVRFSCFFCLSSGLLSVRAPLLFNFPSLLHLPSSILLPCSPHFRLSRTC